MHLDWNMNVLMTMEPDTDETTETGFDQNEVPVESTSPTCKSEENNAKPGPVMLFCMVQLDKLTSKDIKYWSNPCSTGYFLHMQNSASSDSRPYRNAKQNINYFSDADTSSSEDRTVGPGKWNKPHARNIHYPSSGPSKAPIAAHLSIQKKKELAAAGGLVVITACI